MTKVQLGGWVIRVWREEPADDSKPDRAEVRQWCAKAWEAHGDAYKIAVYILSLERVNAVEVLNRADGYGEVLYKDWP